MGDVQAMAGLDRLPWLADDARTSAPRARRRQWPLWLAAALAALGLVAAAAYWAGTRSRADDDPIASVPQLSRPPVTVQLPAPREAMPPSPEVRIDTPPEVEPIAAPPAPAVRPQPNVRRERWRAPAAKSRTAPKRTASKPAAAARPKSDVLPIWPVRAEQNAAGRLVRVGTFATPLQAKRGWGKIMRFYPGMKRLPALVVPIRAVPSGRQYFRLQMGTTSQAHSEVLCQRMRTIGVSCVVLNIGTTRR